MLWFQNSTKSVFGISEGSNSASDSNFTIPLSFVVPIIGQLLAETGVLE